MKCEIMARPEILRVRTLRNRDSSFLMAEVLILRLIRDAVVLDVVDVVVAAGVDVVVSLLSSSSN